MKASMSRRAFVAVACGAVCATAIGMYGCANSTSPWEWESDDDLPILCMEVSGGAIVAMPGAGWGRQDDWLQLQLMGGSSPGKEIESISQDGSTLLVRLKDSGTDIETADIAYFEFRLSGGDVASVERVIVDEQGSRYDAEEGIVVDQ